MSLRVQSLDLRRCISAKPRPLPVHGNTSHYGDHRLGYSQDLANSVCNDCSILLLQVIVQPLFARRHYLISPSLREPLVHRTCSVRSVREEDDGLVCDRSVVVSSCNTCRRAGVVDKSCFKEKLCLGQSQQTCSIVVGTYIDMLFSFTSICLWPATGSLVKPRCNIHECRYS